MSGRIWPGALCVMNHHAEPENQGAILRATRFWDRDEEGEWWEFDSASRPIAGFDADGKIVVYATETGTRSDGLIVEAVALTPITPPPSADTTEDRSHCEVESF